MLKYSVRSVFFIIKLTKAEVYVIVAIYQPRVGSQKSLGIKKTPGVDSGILMLLKCMHYLRKHYENIAYATLFSTAPEALIKWPLHVRVSLLWRNVLL